MMKAMMPMIVSVGGLAGRSHLDPRGGAPNHPHLTSIARTAAGARVIHEGCGSGGIAGKPEPVTETACPLRAPVLRAAAASLSAVARPLAERPSPAPG